jgi:Tol biopolymer transport system component
MQCSHCNQEHSEGTLICPLTGEKINLPVVCPQCGKPIDPNWLHCSYCGQTLIHAERILDQQEAQPVEYPQAAKTPPGLSKPGTRFRKANWLVIAAGIGLLFIVVVTVVIAFGNGKSFAFFAPTTPVGKILFTSARDGNPEIYVMNSDGSGQTNITNNEASDGDPAWSADGSKVVFYSARDGNPEYGGTPEIYIMNADGSAQARLTTKGEGFGFFALSPDGQKIAISAWDFYMVDLASRTTNQTVYIMDADGSNQTRLTNNQTYMMDLGFGWSPDGQKITYISIRDGKIGICVINTDGSNETCLTGKNDMDFDWSIDGQEIVFVSIRDENGEIYVMNADGSNQVRLTNNQADDTFPTWSQDGRKIAFMSERDGNREIYVMNTNGSNQTRLTNNEADDYSPVWSR